MESAEDGDSRRMLESTSSYMQLDPKRARFPFCIVWTPLPVISWFIPFIGHIGICREDGVILDFAGPNFVCVDNFAFGAVARYIQINKEKCHFSPCLSGNDCNQMQSNGEATWDDTLRQSTQEFQHRSYNLFTCNCHSYVANNLNRMFYAGHDRWNVVSLAALIFLKGKWVNKKSIARAYLPFVIVFALGIFLGGSSFLFGLLAFAVAITGWFLVGTYCFKNLIQL